MPEPTPPTPPASEGVIAAIRERWAGKQFRQAAQLAGHELDHAVLPLPGDPEGVRVVAMSEVEQWLEGLAIRAENGGLR